MLNLFCFLICHISTFSRLFSNKVKDRNPLSLKKCTPNFSKNLAEQKKAGVFQYFRCCCTPSTYKSGCSEFHFSSSSSHFSLRNMKTKYSSCDMMDRVYYLLIKEKLNVLKDKETASSPKYLQTQYIPTSKGILHAALLHCLKATSLLLLPM